MDDLVHTRRERRRRAASLSGAWLAFTFVFLAVSLGFDDLLHDPDAGSQLSKGQQILFGLHPWAHVDSSVYGPAVFYLSALAQSLSSGRLIGEITLVFLGYSASFLLLYGILDRRSEQKTLALVFLLVALAAIPNFHKYHVLLPQAVFLYGLHRAGTAIRSDRVGLLLAVACCGAGAFRLDFGIYGAIAATCFLVLHTRRFGIGRVSRVLAKFLLWSLLFCSPWIAFLAWSANLPDVAVTTFRTARGVVDGLSVPLPEYRSQVSALEPRNALVLLYRFFTALPLGVFVLEFVSLVRRQRSRPESPSTLPGAPAFLLSAALFAALVNLQASHRIDLSHLKQSLPSSLFVLFLVVDRHWPRPFALRPLASGSALAGMAALVAAMLVGLSHPKLTSREADSFERVRNTVSSWMLTRPEGLRRMSQSDLAAVLRRVREVTAATDEVLYLPYLSQAYYFSERHFGTPFGWWNPGRFHAVGSQRRFVAAMRSTRVVVDQPGFTFDRDPARNARAYAPKVMRHIYATYGLFEVIADFTLSSRHRELWTRSGRFDLELTEWSLESETAPRSCRDSAIAALNTLPVELWGRTARMQQGAGLLVSSGAASEVTVDDSDFRSPPSGLGLLADSGRLFVVTKGSDLVPLAELVSRRLIDTGPAPPGSYRLVDVPCSEAPTFGARRSSAASTVLTLEAPPSSP